MAPKLVGRLLVLNVGTRSTMWRVTSSSQGKAFVVSMATGERSYETLRDLYSMIDDQVLLVKD